LKYPPILIVSYRVLWCALLHRPCIIDFDLFRHVINEIKPFRLRIGWYRLVYRNRPIQRSI